MMIIDPERVNDEINWFGKLQKIYTETQQRVAKYLQQFETEVPKNKDQDKSNSGLKLDRMRMPTFNGNIRDYPRFKSDFVKQVQPQTKGNDMTAYALKSCLSDAPYEIVRNVDDDLNEMWRRLDESMNVENELSNTTVISLLEEKLPKGIRREWSKKVSEVGSKIDDNNRFSSFMEFLIEQRRIIEYESANIRMSMVGISGHTYHVGQVSKEPTDTSFNRAPRCLIHGTNSHVTQDCRVYQEKTPLMNHYTKPMFKE